MPSSLGSKTQTSSTDIEPVRFVHMVSEAHHLLPSASLWNSIEIDFNLIPQSSTANDSILSQYSNSASIRFLVLALILLVTILPNALQNNHRHPSKNLTLALNQDLTFFDAQKSGVYPNNSPVKFRASSGLHDGNLSRKLANLEGCFYDSGNNINWTVIEYHEKYADIGDQLDHVKDIMKWGSDYLLKLFVPPNTTSEFILYSQANLRERFKSYSMTIGSGNIDAKVPNDIARKIYESAITKLDPARQAAYTEVDASGGESRNFNNSSGFQDELVWGWLMKQVPKGIFYWNNKLTANAVILLPTYGARAPLEYAATASLLSKLYSDYLDLLRSSGGSCSSSGFSVDMLRNFLMTQAIVNYILGENPMKLSYMVGFGDKFPTQVHHRSASIPWDGHQYSCEDGERWKNTKDPNPNLLLGAMVAGPDELDKFVDERDKQENAGLVAALIAVHVPPRHRSSKAKGTHCGIDQTGIFGKIRS
ncbi:endoglucanase 25-like [Pyrus ussuriensis x Pyrus communis]|uniref:Endoglucanase n=1 Tax=Pyrus ussuriensis x Pyrus communis TaxID=2448454 RepID=A0A5N5FBX7_9ROSA|nr:endoglucanase 25-like [Pyrus ussuriensis x Pyrus communis]